MSIMLPEAFLRHIDILARFFELLWQISEAKITLVEVFPDQIFQFLNAIVGS